MYGFLILMVLAQESISQDILLRVDDQGDATIEIQFQLGAKSWIQWRNLYGDHPDLLRRDLIHRFSKLEISDITLNRDDMNRKATATLKARGEARYRGAGRFEIEIPGTWKKVTGPGRETVFSSSEVVDQGVILQQTVKIVLPEKAMDVKLSEVVDGQATLSYTLPQSGGLRPWPILAVVSLLGLIAVTALRFTVGKA